MKKLVGLAFISLLAVGCGASRVPSMRPAFTPELALETPTKTKCHNYEIEKVFLDGVVIFTREYCSDQAALNAFQRCAFKITRDDGEVIWQSKHPECSVLQPKKKSRYVPRPLE